MITYRIKKYIQFFFKRKWRKINSHNQIYPNNYFSIEKVSAGNNSYGYLNISYYGNPNEKLLIGKYVSIADYIKFRISENEKIILNNYNLNEILSKAFDKNTEEYYKKIEEIYFNKFFALKSRK